MIKRPNVKMFQDVFFTAMRNADVPAAVAIMTSRDDDPVILPYGHKKQGNPTPVCAHTLFPIASISKQFAGLTLCAMQRDGHLSIDDPIQRYLPNVPIGPADLWEKITVADLLTHGTGLNEATMENRHSLLMQGEEAIHAALKHAQPDAAYKTRYSYFNPTYYLLPLLIQKFYNLDWVTFLKQEFLIPMGCVATTSQSDDAPTLDLVTSYMGIQNDDGSMTHVEVDRALNMRLNMAGGLLSNGHDMAHILKFHLNQGAPLFKHDDIAPLYAPHMPIDPLPPYTVARIAHRRYHLKYYGLGLKVGSIQTKSGDNSPIYLHEGATQGARGIFTVLPDFDIGFCILTSMGGHDAASHVVFQMLDESLMLRP